MLSKLAFLNNLSFASDFKYVVVAVRPLDAFSAEVRMKERSRLSWHPCARASSLRLFSFKGLLSAAPSRLLPHIWFRDSKASPRR